MVGITSLSDMLHGQEQGWKWESISFELPPSVKDKIRAIPRHYLGGGGGYHYVEIFERW